MDQPSIYPTSVQPGSIIKLRSGRVGLIVSTVWTKIRRYDVMEDGFELVCLRAGTTRVFESYVLVSRLGTDKDFVEVLHAAVSDPPRAGSGS